MVLQGQSKVLAAGNNKARNPCGYCSAIRAAVAALDRCGWGVGRRAKHSRDWARVARVCEAIKEALDGERPSTLRNTMYKGTHGTVDVIWWHHGQDSGAPRVLNWSDGFFCLHGLAELDWETEIFTCRRRCGGCHQHREPELIVCHGIAHLRCKSRRLVAQTHPTFGWGERGLVWSHLMGPDLTPVAGRLNLGSTTTPEANQSSTSFLHRPTIDASTTALESEQSKARLRYGHGPPSSEPSWGSNTFLKHQQLRCIRFAAGPCIGP